MLRKLAITCRVSIPLRGSTAEAGTFCNFRCCIKISATAWELCEAKWLDVEWTRLRFANMSCYMWRRYYRALSDVYKLWHCIFIELYLAVWINFILNFFSRFSLRFRDPRVDTPMCLSSIFFTNLLSAIIWSPISNFTKMFKRYGKYG